MLLRMYQQTTPGADEAPQRSVEMDGNFIGLVAVTLFFGIPLSAMYTYYRVRRLRTEERLAAIARGANVVMEPDLSEAAHSRRWGILLSAISLGFIVMMALIARAEPDAWKGAAIGIVPLAAGLGFLLDSALIRRDLKAAVSSH